MPAASLKALLTGAIDYAGLFPPAALELQPALQNQAQYVRSPDRWMLGSFILPVGKFEAAARQFALFDLDHPLEISVLGPKTADHGAFAAALETAVRAAGDLQDRCAATLVRQLEIPFPAVAALEAVEQAVRILDRRNFSIFLEAPPDEGPSIVPGLAGTGLGFKLRTGGVTADAFPTDAQIARVLVAAARNKVPIKFTAGLHHPVKIFHRSVQTKMHGFLNVLGAAVLAAEHGWSEAQTEQMLAEEDAKSFVFDDRFFRWRDWQISTDQITARRKLVTSLGSCSFDEPRDDLRSLQLF